MIEERWLDGGPRELPSAERNFGPAFDLRCDGGSDFWLDLDFALRA